MITRIESLLVSHIRPSFLSVTQEEDYIHVIISHPSFGKMFIEDRIELVFDLLDEHLPETERMCIIVECFSSSEIEDLFEGV